MDGVVGDADEHAVERLDEDVDAEDGGDRGEGRGQAGKGMAAHAQVGRGAERDEDQIAGIGRDARDDADEDEDVGQGLGRRNQHELANEGRDQARRFGDADAQHRDDDDADGAEIHEVRDDARIHEANAVDAQQAASADRLDLDRVSLRVDGFEGDSRAEKIEQVGQHHHQHDQQHENHGGVRYLVADAFDEIQHAGHPRFRSCRRFRRSSHLILSFVTSPSPLRHSDVAPRKRGARGGAVS